MEEQKKNNENVGTEAPKYTYEQLNDLCGKFYQENQYLKQQLQQANNAIRMFNRLDYLFKVVELAKDAEVSRVYSFKPDFVLKCVSEIEEAIILPESNEEEAVEKGN